MAKESDRLRALAMDARNQTVNNRWTASGVIDFHNISARYEQAAAIAQLAEAIAEKGKDGTP